MRIVRWFAIPLVGALIALPTTASAQMNTSVQFGARLGPEIGVFAYSRERMGDWRDSYMRWTPVTLYDVNGRYYRSSVRGARPVSLYLFDGEYFLPPRDEAWVGRDTRYNYGNRPDADDQGRGRAYSPENRENNRFGVEVGVLDFSAERAGNWRKNMKLWSPVTVYENNGRYYQNKSPGTRAVMIYRYKSEYFLPPQDRQWVNSDKRFNYDRRPNDEDRGRVRGRP
jgi:hypothetical protein